MQGETQKIKEITDFCSNKKILLTPSALSILKERNDWKEIIEELSNETILSAELIKKKIQKTKINLIEPEIIIKEKTREIKAKEIEPNYRIMDEYDVTNKSFSKGQIKDFHECFTDKFNFLSSLLKKKHSIEAKPISKLKKAEKNDDLDLIGMISEKWVTKKGDTALKLEDFEDECIALLSRNDITQEEKKFLMLDDVIAVKGKKINDEMILVKKIYYPDVSVRKLKTIKEEIMIASISDIHVGSKLFLEKEFQKFIDWLNLKTMEEKEKQQAEKIKYLFILGDNVEGIGIYPTQFDELSIKDTFEQYAKLEEFLLQIPEYIEVFMIPGQHDAVRWADPRPAIPEKMMPNASKQKNIHLLGSPSWVEIEGLKVLLYHGNSMHDLFAKVSGLTASNPNEACKQLLKRRDLMVGFGLSQVYVLEKKDYMLIREEPDFFLTGDIHRIAIDEYNGTTIINNATWQERTDYQVKLGHYPTPGIAVTVDLSTRNVTKKIF